MRHHKIVWTKAVIGLISEDSRLGDNETQARLNNEML